MFISVTCDVSPFAGFAWSFDQLEYSGLLIRRYQLHKYFRLENILIYQMRIFTLVNVYVDLVVFTRIAGTSETGSGRYWC